MPRVEVPDEFPHTSSARRAQLRRQGVTARSITANTLTADATAWGGRGGLAQLRGLAIVATILDEETAREVAEAREDGHSWATIGAALGVSKQAAQQRYGVKAD